MRKGQMAGLLVLAVLLASGFGCSQPTPPEQPKPEEPALPAALGVPDLAGARPLALTRTPMPSPGNGVPLDVRAVAYLTPDRAFGAGWTGQIHRTADGGETWTEIYRQEEVMYDRLLIAGNQTGWAFGSRGCRATGEDCLEAVISRTLDGGVHWETHAAKGFPTASASSAWQMHVVLLSADEAWAASPGGPLLRTADGGRTWQEVPLPAGLTPAGGIAFTSPAKGYVSASGGQVAAGKYMVSEQVVLATEDGGRSWRRIFGGSVPIRAIQFLDGQHGLLGGGFSHWRVGPVSRILYATDDGGLTWRELTRSEDYNAASAITGLHFANPGHGWIEQESGPLLYTRDAGQSWGGASEGRYGRRPAVLGERLWLPWGGEGHAYIVHTDDGGKTWSILHQRAAAVPGTIQFVTPQTGFIGTDVGWLKSTDGGESWSYAGVADRAPYPVFASEQVQFRYQRNRGLTGDLERSDDGGRTWKTVMGGVDGPSISFVSPTVGYLTSRNWTSGPAAPYPDYLMKSVDGGLTWQRLAASAPVISKVAFADEQNGAMAGGYPDGRLMVTGDGGETWLSAALPKLWIRSIGYTKGGH
ncbi:MAG TPA: hypothetical protein VD973_08805, partial [Symbiobacteriaceae bacterium]|nr:hypothetical protein [Symbiobacteriaceae bacterium]